MQETRIISSFTLKPSLKSALADQATEENRNQSNMLEMFIIEGLKARGWKFDIDTPPTTEGTQ